MTLPFKMVSSFENKENEALRLIVLDNRLQNKAWYLSFISHVK